MAVFLSGISVAGYRSFPQRLELDLRPLTLLYGRNNAGKSAILRLLPIIGASIADSASSAFDISAVSGPGSGFLDAVSQGNELKRIDLSLKWAGPENAVLRDRFGLKYIDEIDQVIVDRLEIFDGDDHLALKLTAEPYPDQRHYQADVRNFAPKNIEPLFEGLVPRHDHGIETLGALRQRLLGLRHRIQWLKSVRTRWDRLVAKTGNQYRTLASDGAHAAEILLSDKQTKNEAAEWYARSEIARGLEVLEQVPRRYRILLNPETSAHQVDLLDTGEGMIQVLPVLVASSLARQQGSNAILAIEEPESHLHGNAQQALAMHLCKIAASERPPTILAETHSRILMLGIQLAIAERRIAPERVCCYWVDQEASGASLATKVEFDRFGRPIQGWPSVAFEEDQALARRLLDRQLQGGAFDPT